MASHGRDMAGNCCRDHSEFVLLLRPSLFVAASARNGRLDRHRPLCHAGGPDLLLGYTASVSGVRRSGMPGGWLMDVSDDLRDVLSGRLRALSRPKPGSDAECEAVLQALQDSNHNVVRAARLLGVGRATFYRMLERHQIERGRYCHAPR